MAISDEHSFFISINRFERKKRTHVALLAFRNLRQMLRSQSGQGPYLIVTGGYDKRVQENVEHFCELKR